MTQPKSDSATSATKRTLSEESLRAMNPPRGLAGQTREVLAALLVILVLVEGGAGRREQDGVAAAGDSGGSGHGAVHRPGVLDLHERREGLLDRGSRLADGQDQADGPRNGGGKRRELPVLVPAAEDQ